MSSRSYTKRNRPVTACRECHRRKQKCDRLKPCNICLARNVPEKCLYGDDVQKLINAAKSRDQGAPLTPPSDDDHSPPADIEIEQSTATLEEQIGYSPFSDNAFVDLYKSIDAIHIPTAGSLGLSSTPLKPSAKERYFRIVAQLPSATTCQMLINTYFEEANWYFVALDRYFFDRIHAAWRASALPNESFIKLEQYPRDLQHVPALLFQVLAVGLQFSTHAHDVFTLMNLADQAASDKQSQIFSDFGDEIMEIFGRQSPSITGVEQDMMRMNWLKNRSRGTESRHSIGNAISQAQDMELHLESDLSQSGDDNMINPEQLWYDEYRRRVWARLFFLDSHMALVLGRPRHVHLDDCTATLPTNCDIPDTLNSVRPRTPGPGEIPSSFTFVVFLYEISLKIHEIMSARSRKALQSDYRKVEKIHQEVEELIASLPPAMRPNDPDTSWDSVRPYFPKLRQQMLCSANSFLMKLHRPYINLNEASRTAVVRAALGTLEAQQKLFDFMSTTPNQHRIYGFSFYTIDAAILLSAVVMNRLPQDIKLVNAIDLALRQAISRLSLLKATSSVAASGEQLLMQCYAKLNERYPSFMDTTTEFNTDFLVPEIQLLPEQFKFLDDYTLPDPQDFESGAFPLVNHD